MGPNREHPLYYLDAETTLVAIYVWVDDELKALRGSCQEFCVSLCVRGPYRSTSLFSNTSRASPKPLNLRSPHLLS